MNIDGLRALVRAAPSPTHTSYTLCSTCAPTAPALLQSNTPRGGFINQQLALLQRFCFHLKSNIELVNMSESIRCKSLRVNANPESLHQSRFHIPSANLDQEATEAASPILFV